MKYEFIIYKDLKEKEKIDIGYLDFLNWLKEFRPRTFNCPEYRGDYSIKDFEEIVKYCEDTVLEYCQNICNTHKEISFISEGSLILLSGILRLWNIAKSMIAELKHNNTIIILNIEKGKN